MKSQTFLIKNLTLQNPNSKKPKLQFSKKKWESKYVCGHTYLMYCFKNLSYIRKTSEKQSLG